jgi:hypothetical protein
MRSLIKRLFRVLARALFRVRVGGSSEGLDAHARLLVIANHESFLDGLLLGYSCRLTLFLSCIPALCATSFSPLLGIGRLSCRRPDESDGHEEGDPPD